MVKRQHVYNILHITEDVSYTFKTNSKHVHPRDLLKYVLTSLRAFSSGVFSFGCFFLLDLISPVFKSIKGMASKSLTPFWSCFATCSLAAAERTRPPTLALVVTRVPSPFSSNTSFNTRYITALGCADWGCGVPFCPEPRLEVEGRMKRGGLLQQHINYYNNWYKVVCIVAGKQYHIWNKRRSFNHILYE